ncbi:MAG: carboxymuconolactone decarboxylase family protein [Bacteroidota bacterium]
MKNFTVPTIEQVSPESKTMFEAIQKRMAKVPNLYATMGYSPNALKAFMDLDATLSHGVFNGKQREAIALVVSEVNSCAYCLAGHTMAAIKNGLTVDETIEIRKGHAADEKLNAIVQLAKSIAENHGHSEEKYVDQFFAAGFDEAALMELIGFVTARVFTNYVFAVTAIPVDFPAAPALN